MSESKIDGYQRHDVPPECVQKWQRTVDLMAAIFDVPAGLIMRVLPSQIEVLLASQSSGNPYETGEKADLNTGLYCETVMATREPLNVPDALEDPDWKDNPDVELNMISYAGVPLICPDGSVFGTICVLDDHKREHAPLYHDMLAEFRGIIEQDLRMLERDNQLHLANQRLTHELAVARELSSAADREHKLWLQGQSVAVRALRESIELHAANDDAVLLTGPGGAGQEAVARAIHRNSPRAGRPFIYVACPHVAVAGETIFGFDNSDQFATGKLSLADGGTLYLEGIEALNQTAQQGLIKFLRDANSQRAAGQPVVPDVRIISCCSGDLDNAVREGGVEIELSHLLGSRQLAVPSLAQRRDDIPLLASILIESRSRSLGKTLEGFSPQSEELLTQYSWPGNLGEFRSVVERAVVLATGVCVDIPEDLLREGRRVGGYTLERMLGSGAMGEVWLARHSLLARPSAVKLIRQDAFKGEANARKTLEGRFQREARTTAQLRSPHTVELYDFGVTEEGDFYYVMEHLVGVDLETLVNQYGPVSPARAIYLLRQACMSLGEAHLAGLVHRDVKPANFFVSRLGPHFDFLKLLDFGVVRTTDDASQTFTPGEQLTGTPNTMAPEVIQGNKASFEADIYGLACVVHWLVTGKHIFDAPNVMGVLMKQVSEQPKKLSDQGLDVPEELDALLQQCLAKDPADRPRSAFEIAEKLDSIAMSDRWSNERARTWWSEHSTITINAPTDSSSASGTLIWNADETG